eukprot:1452993-Pleurochrysis_carterae.AAC.1
MRASACGCVQVRADACKCAGMRASARGCVQVRGDACKCAACVQVRRLRASAPPACKCATCVQVRASARRAGKCAAGGQVRGGRAPVRGGRAPVRGGRAPPSIKLDTLLVKLHDLCK